MHELGHALGLIHPHDAAAEYGAAPGTDSLKYTVMSYRSYAGGDLGSYTSAYFPTTPMLNDIAALQYLYGANARFNAGDNSYAWAEEKPVYETLWDSGNLNQYSLALLDVASQTLTVKDNNPANGDDGTDTLSGVEKLQFADKTVTVASLIPAVNIGDVTVKEGQSGQLAVSVPVTLTAKSSQTITVSYVTQDADAVAGSDYTAQKGTLTFAPGETQKNIQIPLLGDTVIEPDETLKILLSTPVNALPGDGEGSLTLLNDDAYLFSVGGNVTFPEGNAENNALITVKLSQPATDSVYVNYKTQAITATANSDYTDVAGTLTFAPGDTEQTVLLPLLGDSQLEPGETLRFTLETPQSYDAAIKVALGTPASATATILDDDGSLVVSSDKASLR